MKDFFQIRKALISDAQQIQEVYTEASKTSISHYSFEQVEAIIDNFTIESLEKKIQTSEVTIIEVEGKVIAYSIADLEKKCIWAVFVLPQYQGKGFGKILMERIESFFQEHNTQEVSLYARKGAIQFYKKHGFKDLKKDYIWKLRNGMEVVLSTMKKLIEFYEPRTTKF